MHYLLFYEISDDYIERRIQYRNEHLRLAWESHDKGDLILGGALNHPVDGAVLLFKGDSPMVAESFAQKDPYVLNHLVKNWYVREWSTVVGNTSENPLRPGL